MERVYDLFAKSAAFQRIPYALSDSFGFATQEQSDPGLRQSVLLNTAVSRALDPVRMAGAFANAIRAGRAGFLAGPMIMQDMAVPSTRHFGSRVARSRAVK
jgi:thiazole synthase